MDYRLLSSMIATGEVAVEEGPGFFENGFFWAILGMAFAIMLAGIGSAKGVMTVGSSGLGLLSEDPKQFTACLLLTLLPSTQGIYGFVIAFMILNKANEIGIDALSLSQGLQLFGAALPVGIVGFISGIYQGRVAAASIALAAKQPKHWSKGMIITLTVEMFALFGFLISIFMIG